MRGSPLRALLAGVLGYVLGTLPSAAIAARVSGSRERIEQLGSGNPGAYNTATSLGRRWGVAVGAADVLKGVVAAAAGRVLDGDRGCYVGATAAVAGHTYPPGRKGGKGVATSFGTCLVALPAWAPADLAIGVTALLVRRQQPKGNRAGVAAGISTGAFLVVGSAWAWRRWPNPGGPSSGPGLFGYVLATTLLTGSRWRRA